MALPACTPASDEGDSAALTPQQVVSPSGEPAPEVFAATAWRAVAADGARYTTYLDADGTYRDLRNGDPRQTGSWSYSAVERDKRLCFIPTPATGVERCWEPGRMSGGTMKATNDDGVSIELERVEYRPPAEPDTDTDDTPA
ncbi:hypothetical protein N6L26_11940 [Qipengyuania sp. SS22]|uniref:hypothetical protein n=1 Tax=Qipengyuania sp. SS22 TaxID=2979461 RepID=UPI0021E584EB|nr:hypothetical protein [Qipengyuania sp. SS22]UYH54738.1 hypothetical protein N6L26_11940 [Qipengyuania sp. SS22]